MYIDMIENFNTNLAAYAKLAAKDSGGQSDGLLTEIFRAKMKKMGMEMYNEALPDICYPTGFPSLDYLNSSIAKQKNPETGLMEDYINAGLTDGSYVIFVANTNTGKSTLVNQIIANIARKFPDVAIFFDDIESGMTEARRFAFTGFTEAEFRRRCIIRNSGVTSENVYKRVKIIHDEKVNNPQKYLYDSGIRNMYGEPVIKMKPTIYAVDSIAALMPEGLVDDDGLPGKSYGAQVASNMAVLFQMILQLLKDANIIFIGINHFTTDLNMGPFTKPADVPWLKPGERIPKGKKATLLANQVFRMDQKERLKIDGPLKVNGSVVNVSLVKSRNSGIKTSIPMVYDFSSGFDPWLSMLYYLKTNDMLYGAGTSLSFDPERTFKFSYGTFRDKINNDLEFRRGFLSVVIPILKTMPVNASMAKQDMHFDDLLSDDIFKL